MLRPGGKALFLEFVLPAKGWFGGLICLFAPPLRAVYGIHWRRDLPTLCASAGLTVLEERAVWGAVVQTIIAARRTIGAPAA